jgi:hypothetical protein
LFELEAPIVDSGSNKSKNQSFQEGMMPAIRLRLKKVDLGHYTTSAFLLTMTGFLVLLLIPLSVLASDTLIATQEVQHYVAGSQVTITNTIEYTGTLTALGFRSTLPDGWSFITTSSVYEPDLKPRAGSSGILAFAWVMPPESPFTFTYTVSVPSDENGGKQISSVVLYRRLGGELSETVNPSPLVLVTQ